jgi:NADPH:quinone reductase-like Zn-dependent oxidoreductase
MFWLTGGAFSLGFIALLIGYWTSTNACDDPDPAAPRNPMKAVVYCEYGPPDVLKIEVVEKPAPGDGQVLVRVRAAAVNPLDWHYVRGTPYVMRLGAGLRKPKVTRLGVDFAGTVEAIGRNVKRFAPGDDVFGVRMGALAEYVSVREDRGVAPKPAGLTFEQAASIPVAAVTALQGLRDKGRLRPGQRVLINGASGGVGTFAVQIAKSFGAYVTGVCSTRNVEMVRSLGADRVVDYTREDFAATERDYDLILDNVGNRSLSECRRVLKTGGVYVLIGGGGPADHRWIGPLGRLVRMFAASPFVSQEMGAMLAEVTGDDLDVLRDLVQAGKLTPVIDRRYRLEEAAEAIRYLEEGHARGKVIVTVGEPAG